MMWRAIFLAAGGILFVTGIEAMLLDHVVVSEGSVLAKKVVEVEPAVDEWGIEVESPPVSSGPQKIAMPEWVPWSLVSTGAIVFLYAWRNRGGG